MLSFFFPVAFIAAFAVFLASVDKGCSALTTGCVNMNSQGGACCSGDIEISSSVTSISDYAFEDCTITSVVIPNNVQTIGFWAFGSNQISSLIIPNSVQTIGDSAFRDNQISSLMIGNNVKTIGSEAFANNNFTSLPLIPSSVTSLSGFNDNQIALVVIPPTVTIIGWKAFYCNNITSVTIPNSVEIIGAVAFARNDLASVIIPQSVVRMGQYAFADNKHICLVYKGAKFLKTSADDDYFVDDGGDDDNDEGHDDDGIDEIYYYADDSNDDDNVNYPECDGTATVTSTPTYRPTILESRPVKGVKFRGSVGVPPAFAAFINSEEATDRSPDANIEYHCFEHGHGARYVRGTYGMRGYFEGKLDGHTAYVNFFEVTNDGESLVPTTGSAAITYSDDWLSADGPFWNTGSSTMPGSWGSWGALESCVNCFPSDMSMKRIRKEKCLWSDNEHSHYKKLPDLSDRIMGSEQTANTWFNIGYGPRNTSGVMVGSYHYTYTAQQCNDWGYDCSSEGFDEVGSYGTHSVSANVKGGRILASDLQINTGPLSGHIGSGLYLIFNYKDGSVGYTGYFCSGDWIEDGAAQTSSSSTSSGNIKLVLVDCSYDAGDEMAADSYQALRLLGAGYDKMWNIYSMEWQRLSRFFQTTTITY